MLILPKFTLIGMNCNVIKTLEAKGQTGEKERVESVVAINDILMKLYRERKRLHLCHVAGII